MKNGLSCECEYVRVLLYRNFSSVLVDKFKCKCDVCSIWFVAATRSLTHFVCANQTNEMINITQREKKVFSTKPATHLRCYRSRKIIYLFRRDSMVFPLYFHSMSNWIHFVVVQKPFRIAFISFCLWSQYRYAWFNWKLCVWLLNIGVAQANFYHFILLHYIVMIFDRRV